MSPLARRPATDDDAAAVAELVIAYERSLYGETAYSHDDLEMEWRAIDLARDTLVLLDGDEVVAFGSLHDRGELWRTDAYVHPAHHGRGIGAELAVALAETAGSRGAVRIQSGVAEPDEAGRRLFAELGYTPVRVFREMRIELEDEPTPAVLPGGLVAGTFDADRDGRAFHAAQQDAFADHWEARERTFEEWRDFHLVQEKFDPSLWGVVRAGDEIVAGVICVADRYGGGWVAVLFTRRPWRGRGVGRALLQDAFV
ncbi:MAG TPA: GNAT family N-acetyltransferase, partial [Gaiellaceae bacterium]|nr:GNAT family N-acetyltransferase [Gaiellaceae bacterium]